MRDSAALAVERVIVPEAADNATTRARWQRADGAMFA